MIVSELRSLLFDVTGNSWKISTLGAWIPVNNGVQALGKCARKELSAAEQKALR